MLRVMQRILRQKHSGQGGRRFAPSTYVAAEAATSKEAESCRPQRAALHEAKALRPAAASCGAKACRNRHFSASSRPFSLPTRASLMLLSEQFLRGTRLPFFVRLRRDDNSEGSASGKCEEGNPGRDRSRAVPPRTCYTGKTRCRREMRAAQAASEGPAKW
jgi:hypothetical protein